MERPLETGSAARAEARPEEVDRATLERCRAQDFMAFRAFVTRYERAVFALLSRLVGQGPNLEDLAQETFLRAFRAFPRFDPDGPARPSTWLLTIATRLGLDARRRRANEAQPLERAEHVAVGTNPEIERERRELGRAIARAADGLSDDQRAVFVLAEFHDLSHAEIAQAVGVPEATVKTRLFRARAHMRAELRALRGTEEERHGR